MKNLLLGIAAGVVGLLAVNARAVTLYDGGTGSPSTPTIESQGWLTLFPPSTISGTATSSGGHTTLDTTSSAGNLKGYSNHNPTLSPPPPPATLVNSSFPNLDRTSGFTLSFTAKLDSETHTNSSRAGFDVILLGSDMKGIELGFWDNNSPTWSSQIWAQGDSPLFTKAESTADSLVSGIKNFDPGSGFHNYDLKILGGNYSLFADGTDILDGAVRDYTSSTNDLAHTAYHTANFLFMGDDTSEASAAVEISQVSISVPEPTGMIGVVLVYGVLFAGRRSRVRVSAS